MSASDIDMHPPDIHAHKPIQNIPFSLHIFFLKLVFIDLCLGELHHETETLMSFLTEG